MNYCDKCRNYHPAEPQDPLTNTKAELNRALCGLSKEAAKYQTGEKKAALLRAEIAVLEAQAELAQAGL